MWIWQDDKRTADHKIILNCVIKLMKNKWEKEVGKGQNFYKKVVFTQARKQPLLVVATGDDNLKRSACFHWNYIAHGKWQTHIACLYEPLGSFSILKEVHGANASPCLNSKTWPRFCLAMYCLYLYFVAWGSQGKCCNYQCFCKKSTCKYHFLKPKFKLRNEDKWVTLTAKTGMNRSFLLFNCEH